jgi:hypothetical protein
MKREQMERARFLRGQGMSLNEIVATLGVSKASVSLWVRNIALTSTQRAGLSHKGRSLDSIEKRRINRIKNTEEKHAVVITHAKKAIPVLSKRELFLVGVALYWGEGGKTQKGTARVANSDPKIISIMMRFFKEICNVPDTKFRGHVHTFSHLNVGLAEEYWSNISGIPRNQFYKTYSKPSVASLGKKDNLPYGTFEINVNDTNLLLSIKGWIERLGELSTVEEGTQHIVSKQSFYHE